MSRSSSPESYVATTDDGASLALYRSAGGQRYAPSVVVTHGTFSDARACAALARAIARQGFRCWTFDWRGHGQSGPEPPPRDFEHVALSDVPAVLSTVRRVDGAGRVLWVAHSGGGFLPLMYLARNPQSAHQLGGLVAIGTQAWGAAGDWRSRVVVAAAAALTNALGRAPGRALGLGTQDEYRGVMNQWYRWNWTGAWLGRDGFDYRAALQRATLPAFFLAGQGDTLIAPPSGCRAMFDALGSDDKQFTLCSRSNGFTEDYNHARLLVSRNAMRDIFPRVTKWLVERAEPLDVDRVGASG